LSFPISFILPLLFLLYLSQFEVWPFAPFAL
jgi:hypothetical protein